MLLKMFLVYKFYFHIFQSPDLIIAKEKFTNRCGAGIFKQIIKKLILDQGLATGNNNGGIV